MWGFFLHIISISRNKFLSFTFDLSFTQLILHFTQNERIQKNCREIGIVGIVPLRKC